VHHLTFPFSLGNFWPKTTWLSYPIHPTSLTWPPATFLCFLGWKAAILTQWRWSRQNRRQCWTPSQNMTSRMHFKNGRSTESGVYTWNRTTLRVMMHYMPKVSFWPDGSTSPINYGYHLIFRTRWAGLKTWKGTSKILQWRYRMWNV
jgi:hypothetical protein